MKRLLVIIALLSIAVPTAFAARPDDSPSEARAETACKKERGTTATSIAAFNLEHGTNKNKKNAFGKCVSSKSKDKDSEDANDDQQSQTSAAKECKTERGTTATSIAAFELKYGTNKNKKNAFGKCVSKHAKEKA